MRANESLKVLFILLINTNFVIGSDLRVRRSRVSLLSLIRNEEIPRLSEREDTWNREETGANCDKGLNASIFYYIFYVNQ